MGDLPGWHQIFVDDFNRCSLGSSWSLYSGQPGGNPNGWWDPKMVSDQGGMLRLDSEKTATGWISGGVSNHGVEQTYGRWEIRMRADNSDDISYHMLLWPAGNDWPPEIDFAESAGPRTAISAFLHWVDTDGENAQSGATVMGDFSQWHTVGVEWGPGVVRYLLDGVVWAEAHSKVMVPNEPMGLAMQAEAGACQQREELGLPPCDPSGPHPDHVGVEVDWVAVYQPLPSELARMQQAGPDPSAIQMTKQ
ncbi:glycoside hydrolase family 16 protein [Rhodococcus spelaei]|nr:glycoside hydrolase family 16 protein [Rhodococcus spelaei]